MRDHVKHMFQYFIFQIFLFIDLDLFHIGRVDGRKLEEN